MGRTIPSFTIVSVEEEREWKEFRTLTYRKWAHRPFKKGLQF
jgi:hypothetical protein